MSAVVGLAVLDGDATVFRQVHAVPLVAASVEYEPGRDGHVSGDHVPLAVISPFVGAAIAESGGAFTVKRNGVVGCRQKSHPDILADGDDVEVAGEIPLFHDFRGLLHLLGRCEVVHCDHGRGIRCADGCVVTGASSDQGDRSCDQ